MADTTDGGGPSPFSVGQYVENGRIRIGALLSTIVGAGVFAYFEGLVSVILGLADIPISLAAGFGQFAASVVEVLTGFPVVIIQSGWRAALPFVLDAGIAGYFAGLSIVLVTLWIIAEVVSRVL